MANLCNCQLPSRIKRAQSGQLGELDKGPFIKVWAGFRETNKIPTTKAAVAALSLTQQEKGTGTKSPTE